MRRVVLTALALLSVVVMLTGCVSLFVPPRDSGTSIPTGEDVAPELSEYYSQVLEWSPCEGAFQCATAAAPLDWADPGRDRIELALIRSTANGDPRGSLLVNPGGPGGSGYDFVRDSIDYAVSARVQEEFDVVGFDPRGVNRSSAVSCYSDPAELDSYLFDIPTGARGTEEYRAEAQERAAAFAQACLDNTGELLGYIDTESAARDLDLLRSILGDDTLNYLGFSYGTLLGATYAELYPTRTGRLVLDGAVDPSSSDLEVSAVQAQGFESALRAYLAECLAGDGCPFSGDVNDAMVDIRSILDRLDESSLRAADGRQLGSGTMFYAIVFPLYNQANWQFLTELFSTVMAGDPEIAFALADSYYSREEDGTFSDNSFEAFTAINCVDYVPTSTPETAQADAAELERVAPVFGPSLANGPNICATWPVPATGERETIAAAGSEPILVIGTTNDPATPYVWAEAMSSQLENGHLVTYDGEGHTAYNRSNACINDTVDDFLIEGTVPETDPLC